MPSEEQPGQALSVACIVKLYDQDAERFRLCDAVEVVGVLCMNPEAANFGAKDEAPFWDARNPSTSLVPRLHGLIVRQLPFYHPLLPYTPAWLSEAKLASAWQNRFAEPGVVAQLRELTKQALATHLGGDMVAAEYALMLVVSRSFGRHHDQSLGSWSLNIGCWPEGLSVARFHEAMSEFVPRATLHEVTAETLNSGRWRPRKDFSANRLIAGRLQSTNGTLMIFDETQMVPGQLQDAGVRNLAAIRCLMKERQLVCDFMSYDVKIPLETPMVHVSRGKSIIPEQDVLLPLRPVEQNASCTIPAAALEAARLFLALVTRSPRPLNIPDEVTQKFGTDFAAARAQRDIGTELASTWMSLARAYCIAHGEETLTLGRWQSVLELESERIRRCRESKFLTSQ